MKDKPDFGAIAQEEREYWDSHSVLDSPQEIASIEVVIPAQSQD